MPGDDTDLLDEDRVPKIAEHHGIRDGYDLYYALNEAGKYAYMDGSLRAKSPTPEQLRVYYTDLVEHAS